MKKVYIFFILTFILILLFTIQTGSAFAGTKFFDGLQKTAVDGAGYPPDAGGTAAASMNFLAKMMGSALTPIFLGVMGMLLFFYGGYTLMMARGNEQEVERGKNIIINTIMAMIVAFSAYAIIKLIIPLWKYVTGQ